MARAGNTGCIEENPNRQSIMFGGQFVNLSAIARAERLSRSYVSKIFTGERSPSLRLAQQIANRLGMTLDEFHGALHQRVQVLAIPHEEIVELYIRCSL